MPFNREYWDGYRAAHIYVLMEGIETVSKFPKQQGSYQKGFESGLKQKREELNTLIRKERELRKMGE